LQAIEQTRIAIVTGKVQSWERNFMIYSKFGTALALLSKTEHAGRGVSVHATAEGKPEIHEYLVAELKADDGLTEINAAVGLLPLKVFETRSDRRKKRL
jgi:hypothetical protein